MCLPAQIGGFADYVVPPRQDLGNHGGLPFGRGYVPHLVADRNGIGGGGFLQTDLPAQNCRERLPRREFAEQIMAARVLHHRCNPFFHNYFARPTSFSAKRLSIS